METVVLTIIGLVSVSYLMKLSFHGWAGRMLQSVFAAGVILLTYDVAASQSKTQIADWLTQPSLMLDVAVWLTIDVAFQICFCVLSAKAMTSRLSGTERVGILLCTWIPGVLIFPTLFAMLTELVFSFPGVDFALIAWIFAGILLIGLPILAVIIKSLVPETDLRLEMIFMLNLIIAALGVIATVNGSTAAVGRSEIEVGALLGVIAILVFGIFAGLLLNRYVKRKKS